MRTVFFGPATQAPSWNWVGKDVALHLGKKRPVDFFSHASELPEDCVSIWIKSPPGAACLEILRVKRIRVIFLPVDFFQSAQHIEEHAEFLDFCTMIAVHSRSLLPFFKRHTVHLLDHYNKYGIAKHLRAAGDDLLWVGGYQYTPYVLKYLLETGLGQQHRVIILSDCSNNKAQNAARTLARELGMGAAFSRQDFTGVASVQDWSEAAQEYWLRTCAGAFDIKDPGNFNQFHKPPTKLQKYLCSHIPVAINTGLPLTKEFSLDIPTPLEVDHWLGSAYQRTIDATAEQLQQRLKRSQIADDYDRLIMAASQ